VEQSAIVLVIDRLGAGFLGPYGNTWLDTPQFNRLASQALLCETVMADASDLAGAYRAWWSGRHALENSNNSRPPLLQAAANAKLATVLVTDEPAVAEHTDAAGSARRVVVPTLPCERAANELADTAIARLFAAAIDELANLREPALMWVHSRGMAGPWDAPLELRRQFAAEDDPVAPEFVEPPQRQLPDDFDPDELLGIVHAYAGQVALVDACLGLLLDTLDQSPLADQMLLAVASPRGYPLGEHRRVGGDALYGELLHVPLLVRQPKNRDALVRLKRLVQPPDLHATLAEWLGLPGSAAGMFAQSLLAEASAERPARELAYAGDPQQQAIRTRAWLLREVTVDDEVIRQLFAKPDDRWEANEVASRCGDIADQLAAAAHEFRAAAAAGTLATLPPLAPVLTDNRR
jgi:arylsulfatase A-like enzyme